MLKAKCQKFLNCFLQCVFSAVNSGIVKQGKCLPTEYVKEYNVLLHFAMFNCVPTRMCFYKVLRQVETIWQLNQQVLHLGLAGKVLPFN